MPEIGWGAARASGAKLHDAVIAVQSVHPIIGQAEFLESRNEFFTGAPGIQQQRDNCGYATDICPPGTDFYHHAVFATIFSIPAMW